MTFPASDVTTTNTDAGTDSPATARSDILDLMTKFNQLRNHVSPLMQGILASTGALRSYLAGCTMSTAGSSTTMSFAAGVAMDSTNSFLMVLAAISKTTSAWAVGSATGGLDTGTIAVNTTYHFYVIRRPDTGVVDLVFSTSASAPTLPTNYTQYRRIGSMNTDLAATTWTAFVQDGDVYRLITQRTQGAQSNPGTSAISYSMFQIPLGLRLRAMVNALFKNPIDASATRMYVSALDTADIAPSGTGDSTPSLACHATYRDTDYMQMEVMTNTSRQVRVRCNGVSSSISIYFEVVLRGWVDRRGQDA